jgi:hypothetical protein
MPRKLRELIRLEGGMAVPTVLAVILVGLGLAGSAALAVINAQRGSVQDQDRKLAIAAADAGVYQALLRQNRILTTDTGPCLIAGALGDLGTGTPLADGWCAGHTGTVGSTSFAYRVSPTVIVDPDPGQPGGQVRRRVEIVSTGTSDNIARRVEVTASAATGEDVFGGFGAVGLDGVSVGGEADVGTTDAPIFTGSNEDIVLEENGTLCGDAQHGVGDDLVIDNNATWCTGGIESEGFVGLPPPDQGDAPTDNSNDRLFSLDPKTGNARWDAATRTLTLKGSATVTLGGFEKPYSFCRLVLEGSSTLYVAQPLNPSDRVTVFFDSPENCPGLPQGNEQLTVTGSSQIVSTGADPTDAAFYFVGSDSLPTTINLAGTGNVLNEFVLYAPRTDIIVVGTATYVGAMVGKTLEFNGTVQMLSDESISDLDIPVLTVYHRDRYVECTGATATPPDANC